MRLIKTNNITKEILNFNPVINPLSLALWLAMAAIPKKLIAVSTMDNLLIVELFIPVKLIREVIIAIVIITRKNIPKYFK